MKRAPGYGPDDAYCVEPGCGKPATHERPVGMWHDFEVAELVCADHDLLAARTSMDGAT